MRQIAARVVPSDLARRDQAGFERRSFAPGVLCAAEQIAGGLGPDVLTLEGPVVDEEDDETSGIGGAPTAIAIAEKPPKVQLHAKAEVDQYARKASAIAIRHSSNHKVVAIIEIVSPGNKSSRHALSKFVAKAVEFLEAGVHRLIIDLIPPGTFDPRGIHAAIWEDYTGEQFMPSPGQPAADAGRLHRWRGVRSLHRTHCCWFSPDRHAPVSGSGSVRPNAFAVDLPIRMGSGASNLAKDAGGSRPQRLAAHCRLCFRRRGGVGVPRFALDVIPRSRLGFDFRFSAFASL